MSRGIIIIIIATAVPYVTHPIIILRINSHACVCRCLYLRPLTQHQLSHYCLHHGRGTYNTYSPIVPNTDRTNKLTFIKHVDR